MNHSMWIFNPANLSGLVIRLCMLSLCWVLSACGGGGTNPGCGPVVPCFGPEFLYVVAQNEVVGYPIEKSGLLGAPASVPGPSQNGGMAVAHSAAPYLYVADYLNSEILGYSINTSTGALTVLAGSPFPIATVGVPPLLTTDQAGKFLYASTTNGVYGFTLGAANGALTSTPGSPFSLGGSAQGTADGAEAMVAPSGKFLYVATYSDPNSQVAAFSIDPTTGILTAVPGSPFLAVTGGEGWGVAMDTGGKFLYLTITNLNELVAFTVDSGSGALSLLAGFPIALGVGPTTAIVSQNDVLYVTAAGGIWAYSINSTNGSLTLVNGSPFGADILPVVGANITFDNTGNFLYGPLFGFSIAGTSGGLTPLNLQPPLNGNSATAVYP
jgi:6-phosphogluconolactonase